MIKNDSIIPTLSVLEISNKIKFLLENNLKVVKVRGEITGVKISNLGHGYFMLKDANAILATTCWKYHLTKLTFKLEDGLEVIITGKITAYIGQSKYQISAEKIVPAGTGAFIQILQKRRIKLEKEGFFAKSNKQKLPLLPKKIGIITSITGAVLQDIIHRISDRHPLNIIIWPVPVQGDTAANKISSAIVGFNNYKKKDKPDVLIIARGGGSIEDLWPFNEENIVKTIYNSSIPIITAIGHETDYTLIDLVSDVRAPTPTAAAEFAVPVSSNLKYTIQSLNQRINCKLIDLIKYYLNKIKTNDGALQRIANNYISGTPKLGVLTSQLMNSMLHFFKNKKLILQQSHLTVLIAIKTLEYKSLQCKNCYNILINKQHNFINQFLYKLKLNSRILSSLDYKNILKRGYAMIKDENKNYISSVTEAKNNVKLKIKMQDGEISVTKLINNC
jgi:exodeoxyribonuclease VII large subunit